MSRYLMVFLCCLSLSACVLSVDGYAPDADPALAAALLGTWKSDGGDSNPAVVVISRGDDGELDIEYTDENGKHGRFGALAGRLGGRTVLDVWPLIPQDESLSDTYTGSLISGHALLVLEVEGDQIVAHAFDPDVVETAVTSKVLDVPYLQMGEGTLILTGTYENLHSAFAVYASRPGVFGDGEPGVWRRASLP